MGFNVSPPLSLREEGTALVSDDMNSSIDGLTRSSWYILSECPSKEIRPPFSVPKSWSVSLSFEAPDCCSPSLAWWMSKGVYSSSGFVLYGAPNYRHYRSKVILWLAEWALNVLIGSVCLVTRSVTVETEWNRELPPNMFRGLALPADSGLRRVEIAN